MESDNSQPSLLEQNIMCETHAVGPSPLAAERNPFEFRQVQGVQNPVGQGHLIGCTWPNTVICRAAVIGKNGGKRIAIGRSTKKVVGWTGTTHSAQYIENKPQRPIRAQVSFIPQ